VTGITFYRLIVRELRELEEALVEEGGGGVPVRCKGKRPQGQDTKGDTWRSVGGRRSRRVDETLKRKEIQASIGVLSVANLQTVWPVVRVEAREVAEGTNRGWILANTGKNSMGVQIG
jgi:hypothetical protein